MIHIDAHLDNEGTRSFDHLDGGFHHQQVIPIALSDSNLPAADFSTKQAQYFVSLLRDLHRPRKVHDIASFISAYYALPPRVANELLLKNQLDPLELDRSPIKYVVEDKAGSNHSRKYGNWRVVYVRGYRNVFGLRVKVYEFRCGEADFRYRGPRSGCTAMLASANAHLAECYQLPDDFPYLIDSQ
jgi:hypothetical protein